MPAEDDVSMLAGRKRRGSNLQESRGAGSVYTLLEWRECGWMTKPGTFSVQGKPENGERPLFDILDRFVGSRAGYFAASELQAALGVSTEEALTLLRRANGCVETAAEMFYDGTGDDQEEEGDADHSDEQAGAVAAAPAAAGGLSALLKDKGSSPKATPSKKSGKKTAAKKPAAQQPQAKKAKKGSSSSASAGSKTLPGNQRSITSFFSGGGDGASPRSSSPAPSLVTAPPPPPPPPAAQGPITTSGVKDSGGSGTAEGPVTSDTGKKLAIEVDIQEEEGGEEDEGGIDLALPLLGEEEDDDDEGEKGGEIGEKALEKGLKVLPAVVVQEGKKEAKVLPSPLHAAAAVDYGGVQGSPVNQPCGKYDPVKHACWKPGKPAPYLHLAWSFELLCSTTKRLAKADILVNMFRSLLALSPESVLPAVYLSSNKLSSSFEGVDINVGGAAVGAAVQQATGCSSDRLRQLYQQHGDLGDVAQAVKSKQKLLLAPEPFSIKGVFDSIINMSNMKGQGCGEKKKAMMVKMLASCRGPETRFLVRTLVQNIRTGATLTSVLAALSMAAVMHHLPQGGANLPKLTLQAQLAAAQEAVKECYNACPDIGGIVKSLIEGGIEAMKSNCRLRVGMPIKPMLAKICAGVPDMMSKFHALRQPFTCEYKYDGQRAQVHLQQDGTVKIYSRHSEDMTDKYPDVSHLIQRMQQQEEGEGGRIQDLVVDCELVAVDRAQDNKLLPFQTLSTRGRKDVTREQVTVHVCMFAFDLLYYNGESWVERSFRERRAKLEEILPCEPGHLSLATHLDSDDEQEISAFFQQAFDAGCEGIMCKLLDGVESQYEPSKRSDAWLKLKRDYVDDLHDTLDLVPIGGWYGNGRKVKWFSPILMACYDPATEELQSVCRCMSGFSDEFYAEMTRFYKEEENSWVGKPKNYVRTGESPSVWFRPCQVWEIRGAELTVSPVHKAALGHIDPNKGLSLRFPRFLRVREDKAIEDATTAAQIADMFRLQARKLDVGGGNGGEEEDEDAM